MDSIGNSLPRFQPVSSNFMLPTDRILSSYGRHYVICGGQAWTCVISVCGWSTDYRSRCCRPPGGWPPWPAVVVTIRFCASRLSSERTRNQQVSTSIYLKDPLTRDDWSEYNWKIRLAGNLILERTWLNPSFLKRVISYNPVYRSYSILRAQLNLRPVQSWSRNQSERKYSLYS